MSAKKTFRKMKNNPKGDFSINDVAAVARWAGVALEKPSSGSHFYLVHPEGSLSIPARRPIKPVYIKRFVSIISDIMDTED